MRNGERRPTRGHRAESATLELRMAIVPLSFAAIILAAPRVQASDCAEKEALRPGDSTRTLASGGRVRTYELHVPKSYERTKNSPLAELSRR